MARGRVGSRRLGTFPARRPTVWDAGFQNAANQLTTNSVVLMQSLIGLVGGRTTLVRVRGELLVASSAVTIGDAADIAVGMGVVTNEARAAGVGSIPTPITSEEWDGWFWYQACSIIHRPLNVGSQTTCFRYVIDSKAMRIIDTDSQSIVLVAEMANETGAVTVDLRVNTRNLLLIA